MLAQPTLAGPRKFQNGWLAKLTRPANAGTHLTLKNACSLKFACGVEAGSRLTSKMAGGLSKSAHPAKLGRQPAQYTIRTPRRNSLPSHFSCLLPSLCAVPVYGLTIELDTCNPHRLPRPKAEQMDYDFFFATPFSTEFLPPFRSRSKSVPVLVVKNHTSAGPTPPELISAYGAGRDFLLWASPPAFLARVSCVGCEIADLAHLCLLPSGCHIT